MIRYTTAHIVKEIIFPIRYAEHLNLIGIAKKKSYGFIVDCSYCGKESMHISWEEIAFFESRYCGPNYGKKESILILRFFALRPLLTSFSIIAFPEL